jgi:DNA-binding transcriptional LysR family regulator
LLSGRASLSSTDHFIEPEASKSVAFTWRIVYISPMREVNINALDLNLLIALKALLDEQHVTRAAEKVGLSQPAMSRALGRLRVMFKDPLLVKGASGMSLTSRARELYQPLQNILGDIGQLMTAPTFVPSEMTGEIVIATRDYEMAAILPQAIKAINEEAPGISIRIMPLSGDDLSPLERHEVDFVVAGTDRKSSTLSRKTLFTDNFVCVVSAEQSVAKKKLTMESYLAMRHCIISFSEFRSGIVDSALAKMGLERKAVVTIPQFLAASHIVANSDLILTIPKRLGKLFVESNQFLPLDLPFDVPSFSIYIYWHIRNENNPMHTWIRNKFLAVSEI